MNYNSRLDDLMTLLQGRAIDPSQAVQSVWDLEDQKREARQAQEAAAQQQQADALASLLTNVTSAAGTPTTLEGALRLTQAQSEIGQGDVQGGLDQLFLPTTSSNYPGFPAAPPRYPGNSGQSRLAPSLRPEDEQDIINLAQSGAAPQNIIEGLHSIYGPETLSRLMPDIQALLTKYGTTNF